MAARRGIAPGGDWRQPIMRHLRMAIKPSMGSTVTRMGRCLVGAGRTSASGIERLGCPPGGGEMCGDVCGEGGLEACHALIPLASGG